ncbi:hypothetical protein CsSME_00017474 [Camellia sinensis var. sinensis]
MLEMLGAKQHRRKCPIWFSLVASKYQGGDVPLPQISACYLRIKCMNGEASWIEMDENQTNQEQQLKGLVDERMKEIKSIAQKVCPRSSRRLARPFHCCLVCLVSMNLPRK